MDFILEIIFDLILESSMEIASDKKTKKWIRYPLAFLLSLFLIAVIGALLFVGIMFILDKEIEMKLAGILFIVFDIIITVSAIKKLKKKLSKKENELRK